MRIRLPRRLTICKVHYGSCGSCERGERGATVWGVSELEVLGTASQVCRRGRAWLRKRSCRRRFSHVAVVVAAMQSHTGYEFTNYMRAKGEYENQSMKHAAEEMKAKQAAKEKYPLHFACGEGATAEEVASLITADNINYKLPHNGATPIFMACQSGHDACLPPLLKAGANPSLSTGDDFNYAPLHAACSAGSEACAKLLIDAGAKVDARAKNDQVALHVSASPGLVEMLIAAGASVNIPTNDKGMTPLQYCVENKNGIGCVNPLIKAKANVNAVNKGGVQPLHAAAQLGDAPVVKVLLEAGAERETAGPHGFTPLYCAAMKGHGKCMELLLAAGTSPCKAINAGFTPLHALCEHGHSELLSLIIEAKADVNAVAMEATPLYLACQQGHTACLPPLIAAGSDVCHVGQGGGFPLFIACQLGQELIVKPLLEAKAKVHQKTTSGACVSSHRPTSSTLPLTPPSPLLLQVRCHCMWRRVMATPTSCSY